MKGKGCVRAASACSVCPGRETWVTAALGRIISRSDTAPLGWFEEREGAWHHPEEESLEGGEAAEESLEALLYGVPEEVAGIMDAELDLC